MSAWTPGWGEFPQPLLDFWTQRHLCTLTTLRTDGRPHVVPVGVALDHEQRCAWVIAGGASLKVRLLARAGSDGAPVAACQVDGARWSTLEGVGAVTRDPDDVARACAQYAARYRTPRVNPERVAIRVDITRLLCSASLLDA